MCSTCTSRVVFNRWVKKEKINITPISQIHFHMDTNHVYIYRHNKLLYTLTLRFECLATSSNTSLPLHTVTQYSFCQCWSEDFYNSTRLSFKDSSLNKTLHCTVLPLVYGTSNLELSGCSTTFSQLTQMFPHSISKVFQKKKQKKRVKIWVPYLQSLSGM